MNLFTRLVIRYAGWVAAVGTLLAGVGLYYSILLYKNLRTDVEELLPSTARSVIDIGKVTERLDAIDNLVVLTISKDTQGSKRFIEDLARKLGEQPKTVVAGVEYRLSDEIQFFRARQALFMDIKDLELVRDFIQKRIEYEKSLYNPLNIFAGKEIPEPKLDFNALKKKYQNQLSGFDHYPGGYYATPDEKKRILVAYLPGKLSGIEPALRLEKAVNDAIAALGPKTYAADLEIHLTGNVQNMIEEHHALIADLELSTVIVAVLVTIAMLAYFRSFWATMALLTSLFMGTFWTFGISYPIVGYLNANSAFLASIVIGNGINFGIIYLARYLEERRSGFANSRAIAVSIRDTLTATLTAAFAAGLAYGSLILTDFRGFKQFGIIGFVGMVLCWASAYTLLPAYLTVLDRWIPLVPKGVAAPKPRMGMAMAWVVDRFPRIVWGIAFLATIASIAVLSKTDFNVMETNLLKLRDKQSMEHGSGYYYSSIYEIFRRYLTPIVALPETREQARALTQAFKTEVETQGDKSQIIGVSTLDDFVPPQQKEKIEILHDIQRILSPRLLWRLSPEDQRLAGELLRDTSMRPLTESELPPLVIAKFTEKSGAVGNMVLIDKRVPPDGVDDAGELMQFAYELRGIVDKIAPGTPVAGQLLISADMIIAISKDGPKATLFAFLAVVALTILLFRNLRTISLVLFSLCLGVVWMAAVIVWMDLKINFLNFIALPITFGIGVDYGVNVFQRYRQEGRGKIVDVIAHTGSAVALCSLSTIIGYGSLLIAGNQAFVSFGKLAVLGEICCALAAIIALPAFLRTRDAKVIG